MGFFDSKTFTEQNTLNQTTNQQVAAGEEGFAVGGGAVVNIEDSSDEVAISAIRSNEDVSRDALRFGQDAVEEGFRLSDRVTDRTFDFAEDSSDKFADISRDSLILAERTVDDGFGFGRDALDFSDTILDRQLASVEKARQGNLNFARQQAELIAAQAGVVPPASNDRLVTAVIVSVVASVLAPVIRDFFKGKK